MITIMNIIANLFILGLSLALIAGSLIIITGTVAAIFDHYKND